MRLKGRFIVAGEDANGEFTSPKVLKKAVEHYIKTQVDIGAAVGHLGHMKEDSEAPCDFDTLSHRVVSMTLNYPEGEIEDLDEVYAFGVIETLPTKSGRLLEKLIKAKVTLGISTFGRAQMLRKDGKNHIQGDYRLIAIDVVQNPAINGCWLEEV